MSYLSTSVTDSNNLGYFPTLAALETAYPVGVIGAFAVIGATNTIWTWDEATTAWVNTGNAPPGASGPTGPTGPTGPPGPVGPGAMVIGDPITSATAGSVLFAGVGGVLQQDNANFFYDDTNNRLGLGTITPAHKLDVAGDINISTGSVYRLNGEIVIQAQTALNNFFFGRAGNLTMTGTDNTGIGRDALLANTTGTANTAIGRNALLANTTGSNNIALGNSTGADLTTGNNNTFLGRNTARGITTGNQNTIIGSGVTGLAAGLSNNIIIADGSGNRRINVDASGNVGIGTTAPASLLDVNGVLNVGNLANTGAQLVVKGGVGGSALIHLERTGTAFDWSLAGGGLAFRDITGGGNVVANMFGSGGVNQLFLGQKGRGAVDTSNSLLSATTLSNTASITDGAGTWLRLQGGLGTGAGVPGDVQISTGTALASGTAAQSSDIRLIVKGETGNVGIGTTNPSGRLDVEVPNASRILRLARTGAGAGELTFDFVGGKANFFSNQNVAWETLSGTFLVTDNNTNATTKAARMGIPHFTNAQAPFIYAFLTSSNSVNALQFGGGTGNGNAATVINFFTAADNTTLTGTNRMTILGDGRIGMGTTTPTATLHLKAGTAAASTAPIKLTSGTLMTTPEAGAIEFLTDAFHATITTGAARRTFAFLESPTFTGTVAGITATMVGLGNVNNTSNATERAAVATLENKRVQPRVSSSASGNITPTKVDFDRYIRTAQSAAITISNPTMDIGEVMAVQITDNATARAITFGTHYVGLNGLPLPATTTVSKVMTMVLEKVTATKVLVSYVNEA